MEVEGPISCEGSYEGCITGACEDPQISESNYLAADVSYPCRGILGDTLITRVVRFLKQLRDHQDLGSALWDKFHQEREFYKEHRRAIRGHIEHKPLASVTDFIEEGAVKIRKAALGVAEAGQNFIDRASNLLSGKSGTLNTEVRTSLHTTFLPGLLEINDQVKTWHLDSTGKTCYNLTAEIETFFHEIFGKAFAGYDYPWLSASNRLVGLFGNKLLSSVNYSVNFLNAFWNGKQMVYGDGDKRNMGSFLDSDTVPSHEIGHAITERLTPNGVDYTLDAGGINESLSDIFAISFSHWRANKKTIDQANTQGSWLIGEGLILRAQQGNALRNMAHPGTGYKGQSMLGDDPQEGYGLYSAWKHNPDQDPHLTSATGNLWFVKLCENLAQTRTGLHSYDLPLHIVLWSMPKLTYHVTYPELAKITLQVTADKFGKNSVEWQAVQAAWKAVEVPVTSVKAAQVAAAA